MLLKIFHFLLNLAAVCLTGTNWHTFFICTQIFECCHFPMYKAKEAPSTETWQHCWDLFMVIVLFSGEVLVVPSQSWDNHVALSWLGIFHVQNHTLHESLLCCWRNKVSEIYKSTFLKVQQEYIVFRWNDVLTVSFFIPATTEKEREWSSIYGKVPYEILNKAFFKALLYAVGHIIVIALSLFELSHPWFTMITFSSSPSLHTSYTVTYLWPFHHCPLAATCPGSGWAWRRTLALAPCSPPPLGSSADPQH